MMALHTRRKGPAALGNPGAVGRSRRVAEKRHELPAPHSINSSAMEQERLRDRQPERLGGRCLPGGLCCNLNFPSLAAVRRRPAPSALRIVKSRTPAQFGGAPIPALKAARTAFTWPLVSERTATCAGRPLEGSFLFRDLGVGSSDAAGLDGSLPRRFASSCAAARSDASSPSSSRLSALGRSFGNRYRRKEAAMSTAACGEDTWCAGVEGGPGADASENRSGVGC